ncbi:ribosome maturation factor RimM [Portibacter lacus]|uniref:Ribosome maturation factor RimM n=1 Tax=Portibacter lacus TaxID=1099794 RepID=A0AA37STL0_9BACT|nr:hypothetical protein [Portibacter lacus]GLR20002.1 ribosome maturation factor RimM [Portibacter lacus]
MNITDIFPDYYEVGFTKKSYGVNGHLRISINDEFQTSFRKAEHCFFLLKGCLVPYFIENLDEDLIKFESCHNPENAKEMVSKTIYLHEDQITERDQISESEYAIFNGFKLVDHQSEQVVGVIAEIVSYPEQEIAMVIQDDNEFMIPLNVHNIKGINQDEQLIFVEIPEGLLDINS